MHDTPDTNSINPRELNKMIPSLLLCHAIRASNSLMKKRMKCSGAVHKNNVENLPHSSL